MTREASRPVSSSSTDVAIIGAGPYGLGLAAHLGRRGVDHRIIGPPMQAWRTMAPGMYLKSLGFATNIAIPAGGATLPEFCQARGAEDYEPIPIATFADYGQSIQQRHIGQVEPLTVTSLAREGDAFTVGLSSGERFAARRVVVAIGLSNFEYLPAELSALPAHLVSHTAAHSDFSPFAGRDVVVIGAGKSALQAAALLHEHGASVQLLARGRVKWVPRTPRDAHRSLLQRVRVPETVLGPGRDNWVFQHVPALLHHLPAEKRLAITARYFGPSGAWWLRDRVDGQLPVREGLGLVSAEPSRDRVLLRLHDRDGRDTEVVTDHVVAGTGFRVDLRKLPFLDPVLRSGIRDSSGAPVLSRHFESSVAGLYFVGPAAAASFGPLFRFVAGSYYTVPHLARHLSRSSGARRRVVSMAGHRPVRPSPAAGRPDEAIESAGD